MIETQRLILRPYTRHDAAAVARAMNDFGISRNLARVRFPYAEDDALDFHEFIQSANARSLFCAVALKHEPAALRGFVSYEWHEAKMDAEFGYWYDRAMWGKGYATEAGRAVLTHAFDVSGLTHLVSGYHEDNPASGNVLRKLGFREVGAASEYSLAQHRHVPSVRLELTRQDWLLVTADQNTSRT